MTHHPLHNYTPLHFVLFALLIFVNMVISAPTFAGAGDLTITPTRAIFDGRERSVSISLINRGSESTLYRIGFTQMRMDEEGNFTEIVEPNEEERFADRMIRYSPRQVTLEPNIGQTVRLLLRKPKDLEEGEYRSHLLFYTVPDMGEDIETAATKQEAEGVSVNLIPIYRISIPVVVRHGDLDVQMAFSELQLNQGDAEQGNPDQLQLSVERSGERSIYGDIVVTYTPEGHSESYEIGRVANFVVYTPNTLRKMAIDLYPPENIPLNKGVLRVQYHSIESKDKPIMAESVMLLQ